MKQPQNGFYILLISVHGLIRSQHLELGRDADTGGQIGYVVDLAKALGESDQVRRVELVTRQVFDSKVDEIYSQAYEHINEKVSIVRLPCGPRRYLRKEVLWPHLDGFIDNMLQHIRRNGEMPDIIHAHYADAGYVGARLVQLLGLPLIFTGHSLGRVKRQRLLEKGSKESVIESQYNLAQRIEAEEITLGNANVVITSTHQEVEEQYQQYENYQPRRMIVIPPGVDLSRFHADGDKQSGSAIESELKRFLNVPDKPMILAISRADERKNIAALLHAYGEHKDLQEKANLVIVAGNRDDIHTMEKGTRDVLLSILSLIDKYDLYGKVAYPKHHQPQDIAALYRLAARSQGVFVNPAFTEPFGLTLIEAAACGLPIVATEDGGPKDIVGHCKNGLLINPLDYHDIAKAVKKVISDGERWQRYAQYGVKGAHEHFSWQSHIDKYLSAVKNVIVKSRRVTDVHTVKKNPLPVIDRMLVCDIDNTLIGDRQALRELMQELRYCEGKVGFAVATGRNIDSTVKILNEWGAPTPDVLITCVGSEIHYGHSMVEDKSWNQHINYRWHPKELRKILDKIPGMKLQASTEQREHKISYNVNPKKIPAIRDIHAMLRKKDLHVKLIYSHEAYLDILPVRASKGLAVRHIAIRWGIEPEHILVAGDSGNDEEMLKGNTLGVVVGNHSLELTKLQGRDLIYFAQQSHAWGILEGMRHYGFLQAEIPKEVMRA